ncbi:MAG: hypothetical protein LBR25_00495 [Erysipelotrichaceae bacterium]|jgi:hypothetical protein|nr:hypothetical protein [Erysipelotrichaceae bacterium]
MKKIFTALLVLFLLLSGCSKSPAASGSSGSTGSNGSNGEGKVIEPVVSGLEACIESGECIYEYEIVTESPNAGVSTTQATFAIKNGQIYTQHITDGESGRVYILDDGIFVADDSFQVLMEMTGSEADEFRADMTQESLDIDLKETEYYMGSGEEEFAGQIAQYEEYDLDGIIYKVYTVNGDLLGSYMVIDDIVSTTVYKGYSTTVPDDLFVLPDYEIVEY